jgi:hypothetical protein
VVAIGLVLFVTPATAAQSGAQTQTFDLQVEGLTDRDPFFEAAA